MTSAHPGEGTALDQALAEALVAVGDGLDLEGTLRRILRIALELTGARYGALGVVSPEGGLAEFLYAGMDEADAERIGSFPKGLGLLGDLIADPRPLRLAHLSEHPSAVGFPPGHPEMDSFLGVPIVAGSQVFGNLYLTEKSGGFDEVDETRVVSLATAAGVAVQNAKLFLAAQTGALWQSAAAELSRAALLGEDAGTVLQMLAGRARELAGADAAVVVAPQDGELVIEVVDTRPRSVADESGVDATDWLGEVVAEGPIALFSGRDPLLVQDFVVSWADRVVTFGQMGCFPIATGAKQVGVLVLLWRDSPRTLQTPRLDVIADLAAQSAVSLALDQARRTKERLRVSNDRERIARDLHDLVVQRLFATGVSLQVLKRAGDLPETISERVDRLISEVDGTIAQIRGTIFELRDGVDDSWRLIERLRGEVDRMTDALGFRADLDVSAELPVADFDDLIDDTVAVVREGLSNVARHADAGSAEVRVSAEGGRYEITISDDGAGVSQDNRRSGLRNLDHRAAVRGGRCAIHSGPVSGAVLTWSVPLP